MPPPLPPKKEVALALLERSSVHVYLDPRKKGVLVPPWLAKQPRLVLQIGLNMPVPIPDLRLDDDSMSCTLSFNHSPFYCVVPWTSVFAMVGDDSRGMVWPDDVPPELAREAGARPPEAAPAVARVPDAPRPKTTLREAPKPVATGKPKRTRKKSGDGVEVPAVKEVRLKEVPLKEVKDEPRARPRAAVSRETAREAPPRAAPQPVQPIAARPPASPPPAAKRPDGRKPKRELPPYLRVVK